MAQLEKTVSLSAHLSPLQKSIWHFQLFGTTISARGTLDLKDHPK